MIDRRLILSTIATVTVVFGGIGSLSLVGQAAAAPVDVPRGTSARAVVAIDLSLPSIPRVDLSLPDATVRDVVAWRLADLGRSDDYPCLDLIFAGESSWRPDAIGDNGDSFGLGQRNAPAHGAPPWPWPVVDQVDWFVAYADDRYGGPCPAADVWQRRADARGGAGWW